MDPQQIALVKSSFAEATRAPAALAPAFYDRLFATVPDLEALFTTDRVAQERKLTVELQAIVDLLDHVDDLVARTRDLGMRHVAFGARSEHYEQVGLAIEAAFHDVLGARFDAETAEAWRYAYNLVAEAMQQGATASTAPRGAG